MNEKDLTDDYIEGLLRDHFKAEVAELPASSNPWDWLKSRLEAAPNRTRTWRVPERDTQAVGGRNSCPGCTGWRDYVGESLHCPKHGQSGLSRRIGLRPGATGLYRLFRRIGRPRPTRQSRRTSRPNSPSLAGYCRWSSKSIRHQESTRG